MFGEREKGGVDAWPGEVQPQRAQRLLRLPEVLSRVGVKRSMIYRMMSEGRFPKSRTLSPKCAVWLESEIDEWIKSFISARS